MKIATPLNLLLAALLVLATIAGVLLIPGAANLPERWGLHGEVTTTLPRNLALVQMPMAAIAVWVIVWMVGRFGTAERRPSTAIVLRWAVPLLTALFALVQLLIVLIGLGVAVPFFHAS